MTNYVYKMVQVPPNIEVKDKNHKGNEAAQYLEQIANHLSSDGWNFYRIDTIGVSVKPTGFGAWFFKKESTHNNFYVITFRKEK